MDGKNWSQGTKFALSYLSSDVPLDNLRLELLINILSEIPSEKEENYFPKAYRFAMKVEDETLAYGLNLLSRKTKDLKNTVRDTLRDRFTERHAMYWFSLKDRVYSLTYNSANPNSLDFQDTERQPFISESSPLTPLE